MSGLSQLALVPRISYPASNQGKNQKKRPRNGTARNPDKSGEVREDGTFICYRRPGGNELASVMALHLIKRGHRTYLDVYHTHEGELTAQLLNAIESCEYFLLICTPGSLDRCISDANDLVRMEIRKALISRKKVILLVKDGFDFNIQNRLPADIRQILNYASIPYVHEFQIGVIETLFRFMTERMNIV